MSSILLAIDRQFAPAAAVSTISRNKCKLSLLSRSAALVEPAIQSPCFAPRGNVVNRKDWIPCISDQARNSFPLLLIASARRFFFAIFAFIPRKRLKTSSARTRCHFSLSLSLSLLPIYPILRYETRQIVVELKISRFANSYEILN